MVSEILDAIKWILDEVFEHQMETGETEWQVGEFANCTGYIKVPNELSNSTYTIQEVRFEYSDYMTSGATLYTIDTAGITSRLYVVFDEPPAFVWVDPYFTFTPR